MRPIKSGHKYWPMIPVLLSVGMGACGTTHKQSSAPAATTQRDKASAESAPAAPVASTTTQKHEPLQDVDGDREGSYTVKLILGGRYDSDDTPLLRFGRPASTADQRAVTTLVDRYHATVAADDGPKGCALMYPLLVEGILEDNKYLLPGVHERTCGAILTVLFQLTHKLKAFDAQKLHVIEVQTRYNEAIALFGSHHKVEHSLGLRRQHNTWKIAEINDTGMP